MSLIPEDDTAFWNNIDVLAQRYFIQPFNDENAAVFWDGRLPRPEATNEICQFMCEFGRRALSGPFSISECVSMVLKWFAQSERYMMNDPAFAHQDILAPFVQIFQQAVPIDPIWAIRVSVEPVDDLIHSLHTDVGVVLSLFPLATLFETHGQLFAPAPGPDRFLFSLVRNWHDTFENVQSYNIPSI